MIRLWLQMQSRCPVKSFVLLSALLACFLSRVSFAQQSAPAPDGSIFTQPPQAGPCQQCLATCRSDVNNPPKLPDIAVLPGWRYRGCWTDNVRDRTLIGKSTRGRGLTVERCAYYCKDFHFFGVEYSNECFCGNYLSASTQQRADTMCNLVCIGDFSHACGGPNMLTLYEKDLEPGSTA